MKAIRYKIKTVNPVIISSKRGDANMVNTKSYIPGNTVLGVFTSLYIKKKELKDAHKDGIFYNWFLKGDLTFTDAHASDDARRYFPNPYSIKEEKYKGCSAYDLMFEGDSFNEPTRSGEAFINIEGSTIYNKPVKKSISFHHSKEDNADNKIFNYESINANQIFEGKIIGSEEQISAFKEYFPQKITVYMGLSKNSQYGRVVIELTDVSDYDREIKTDTESDDEDIVMTLLSDTVIYNDNGFSTADTDNLEKLLGVKIKNSFIRKDVIEQFVGVWKFKNQSETVFKAGSCFKCDRLPDNYEKLQIKGIGEKIHEGFGRVIFGWQVKQDEYSKKSEAEIFNKPPGIPPDFVKKIVTRIIQNRIKDQVILKAMLDEDSFGNLPTKSLCGKMQSIAMNINTFYKNFDEIAKNKIALTQLEKCNNKTTNLLNHIQGDKAIVDTDGFLNKIYNLDEFTKLLKNKDDFSNEMKKVYLKTFFNFMRKERRGVNNEQES